MDSGKNIGSLTITRKAGESVRIGSDIIVHVVSRSDGHVVLRIEAPKQIKILRTELE